MDGPIRLHEEKKNLEEWTLEKLKANKQSQKKRSVLSLGIFISDLRKKLRLILLRMNYA